MHNTGLALLLVLALTGCAARGAAYGNFIDTGLEQKKLARDAANQLAALYAPAKTRFVFEQATADPFGIALTAALRQQGYALVEHAQQAQSEGAQTQEPKSTKQATAALPLHYVLDSLGEAKTYRLSLSVGAQSLSRAYTLQDGAFMPAGYWVWKEVGGGE